MQRLDGLHAWQSANNALRHLLQRLGGTVGRRLVDLLVDEGEREGCGFGVLLSAWGTKLAAGRTESVALRCSRMPWARKISPAQARGGAGRAVEGSAVGSAVTTFAREGWAVSTFTRLAAGPSSSDARFIPVAGSTSSAPPFISTLASLPSSACTSFRPSTPHPSPLGTIIIHPSFPRRASTNGCAAHLAQSSPS